MMLWKGDSMNRLTEQGVTYGSYEFMDDGIHEWINRLSAYEDTGLTPEEIKGLINTNKNLVKQNDKQYKELQKAIKDRDYWKAEALKHAAKLGEIKLLVGRSNA